MLDSIFDKDDFKSQTSFMRFKSKSKSPTSSLLQERPVLHNQIYTNFGFNDTTKQSKRNFIKLNSQMSKSSMGRS